MRFYIPAVHYAKPWECRLVNTNDDENVLKEPREGDLYSKNEDVK